MRRTFRADLAIRAPLTPREITAPLHSYCNSRGYLFACTEGTIRIDLDGNAAGTVSAAEAEHARQQLAAQTAGYARSGCGNKDLARTRAASGREPTL
jgi:ProP effector